MWQSVACTNPKYDEKNVAISGMHKLQIYCHKNVETSDTPKLRRDRWNVEIGTGTFVHMEENITTIRKLQNEIIAKLQVAGITLIKGMLQRRTKMRKTEMENDNVVMSYLGEEGM